VVFIEQTSDIFELHLKVSGVGDAVVRVLGVDD
jgi:hypothetical protein